MNLTKVEAPNHTPEQVREIIDAARVIAFDLFADTEYFVPAFEQACALLGQKAISFVAEPQRPAMAIPPYHGR